MTRISYRYSIVTRALPGKASIDGKTYYAVNAPDARKALEVLNHSAHGKILSFDKVEEVYSYPTQNIPRPPEPRY